MNTATPPGNRSRSNAFWLERSAQLVTVWSGGSMAFALAVLLILVWLLMGPLFHYSDTWQLVINTGTTIITFLMVFLIQRSQNKESQAVQLKLNEIIVALRGASNRLINVENLSEDQIKKLHEGYQRLAETLDASPRKQRRSSEDLEACVKGGAAKPQATSDAPRQSI